MAFTCYASLASAVLGTVGPPAQLGIQALYSIVDTTTNTAVQVAAGGFAGGVTAAITTPITRQADVLPAVQAAIQAQESGTPSLAFIWVGL